MIGRPMTSAKSGYFFEVKERKALSIYWRETDQEIWYQGWSVETGEPLGPRWSAKGEKGKLLHTFSGSNLVLALGDTIQLRDFVTGKQLGETIQTSGSVTSFCFLPEQRLFVRTDQEGQIWDLPTRRMIGKGLKIDIQSFAPGREAPTRSGCS